MKREYYLTSISSIVPRRFQTSANSGGIQGGMHDCLRGGPIRTPPIGEADECSARFEMLSPKTPTIVTNEQQNKQNSCLQ